MKPGSALAAATVRTEKDIFATTLSIPIKLYVLSPIMSRSNIEGYLVDDKGELDKL
jgi:hypothetical protein